MSPHHRAPVTLRTLVERLLHEVAANVPDCNPSEVDFFQLARLTLFARDRASRAPDSTARSAAPLPLLFRGVANLSFAPRDLLGASAVVDDGAAEPIEYEVPAAFFGLYGATAPLPAYFTELVMRDESGVFGRFLDLFNHLLVELYAEAWRKYRPAAEVVEDGSDRFTVALTAVAGGCVAGVESPLFRATQRALDHAAQRWTRPKSAWALAALLRARFPGLRVGVIPLAERWVRLDDEARNRMGQRNASLGRDLAMGAKIRSVDATFRVVFDALHFDQFRGFMPLLPQRGGDAARSPAARLLAQCVRDLAPSHLGYEVELRVRGDTIPQARMGEGGARLGMDTFLMSGGPARDAHLAWYCGACAGTGLGRGP